jgi:pimeloyl-ACP methyl ester carboxylesterase
MKWLSVILVALCPVVVAESVQIRPEGWVLNADLRRPSQTHSERIFLIVHGTWAHSGMEIIDQIQTLLEDSDEASLAVTLSLGTDNRQGFLGCDAPVVANHQQAVSEIDHWVKYLETEWQQVILVGHSRGGNQVVLYQLQKASEKVSHLALIAPMSESADDVSSAYREKFDTALSQVIKMARLHPQQFIEAGVLNCRNAQVLAESLLSYYSDEPNRNTPALLPAIDLPTLVFQGSEDPLAKIYVSQSRLFPANPAVETRWIEGADHFFRDLYADELVEHLLQWLDR